METLHSNHPTVTELIIAIHWEPLASEMDCSKIIKALQNKYPRQLEQTEIKHYQFEHTINLNEENPSSQIAQGSTNRLQLWAISKEYCYFIGKNDFSLNWVSKQKYKGFDTLLEVFQDSFEVVKKHISVTKLTKAIVRSLNHLPAHYNLDESLQLNQSLFTPDIKGFEAKGMPIHSMSFSLNSQVYDDEQNSYDVQVSIGQNQTETGQRILLDLSISKDLVLSVSQEEELLEYFQQLRTQKNKIYFNCLSEDLKEELKVRYE
ncbi:MAG: TIGR04255 family protein [Vampirovibrionales bacterium]|jgi:uncharacterized protein (TIGR04255 family)